MNSLPQYRTYHWSLFVVPLLLGLFHGRAVYQPGMEDEAPVYMMDVDTCAGRDTTIQVLTSCLENSVPIDFMATVPGNPMLGGRWINVDSVPADLSDSTNVELAAFPTGTFRFDYVTPAFMTCPADTARLTIEVTNLRDVSCRDTVNVGLNDSCYFFAQPSLFLVSPDFAGIDSLYEIVLVSEEGGLVGDTISPEYAGEILDVFIRIPGCTESYCMGAIRALDLRPPRIDSIANPLGMDSLLCYDIDSILNIDASWNDPEYTYYIGGPVFSDNCSAPTVMVNDVIAYGECDSSFATLTRTFTAEDDFGQTTDTTIVYPFYIPNLVPAGKLPDVKINTCTPAGTPVPPTYPFIINAFGDTLYITENECDHSSGFEDREFIICGGTRKIERIVKLFNWCTDESVNVDTLNILIGDFDGPLISQGADTITVSTAPFACEASFRLNQTVLEDMFALTFSDCSDTVILSTSFLSYLPEVDFWGTPTGDSSFMMVNYPVNREIVSGIPLGLHGMVINAEDGCGNSSIDTVYFRVKDFISPVVQCDDVINITLNSTGYAQLTTEDADEGTWDNCELDRLRIRRLVPESCRSNYDRNNNGIVVGDELDDSGYTRFDDSTTLGEFIAFWCCDLDSMPTVELWAWDIYGNAGFCELEVLLEDKFAPVAVAPTDTTTDCLDPTLEGDLSNFGSATVVGDECGLVQIVELTPESVLEQCGTGTITRRFQAVKYLGTERELRSSIVEQEIAIEAVNDYEICMPPDVSATCGTDPTIPGVTFAELACDLIAVNIQDVRFDATADECYKIFRTYDIINWCEYDGETEPQIIDRDMDNDDVPGDEGVCVMVRPNGITYYDADDDEFNINPNEKGYWTNSVERPFLASTGFWRYRQIIKVYDAFAPTINFTAQDTFCSINDETISGCQTSVSFPFSVTENCTNQVEVEVYYDENGDNTDVFELPAFTIQGGYPNYVITGFFPIGTHHFVVEARDGCGNTAREVLPFVVADCKAPAPICANQLNVELMPTEPGSPESGMGVVWANDFLRSPIFDCTGQGEQGRVTQFSINRAIDPADSTQQSISFTCADIGELIEVHIYAWDEAGNGDHCTAYVDVQDNNEVCVPETSILAGAITTESGMPVENVEILLSGQAERITHTNEEGHYQFDRLQQGRRYSIRPGLNEEHGNGVSTFDLILIQKHVLGISRLTSPYQLIAADVNNSGGISTLDLIQLRKLILGIGDSFLGNQSWRFVTSTYTFEDPNQPWKEAMPEAMNIPSLDDDLTLDFMAIKIGDVNGNARVNGSQPPPEVRNDDQFILSAKDELLKAGRSYEIPLISKDLSGIQGLQFTLEVMSPQVSIRSIRPALLGNDHMAQPGRDDVWTFSWNKGPGVDLEEATLFTLELTASRDIRLRDALQVSSAITRAEAYNAFDELLDVSLHWEAQGVGAVAFEVLEVAPNPFVEEARLRFSMPDQEKVTLEIFDVKGQLIFQRHWLADAGFNDAFIRANQLKGEGLYLVRLVGESGQRDTRIVLSAR